MESECFGVFDVFEQRLVFVRFTMKTLLDVFCFRHQSAKMKAGNQANFLRCDRSLNPFVPLFSALNAASTAGQRGSSIKSGHSFFRMFFPVHLGNDVRIKTPKVNVAIKTRALP